MSKHIRIPRTTAMFVTNLGKILRENFCLSVYHHEHWTFERVAKWEECTQKGECRTHGISDEFQAHLDANPNDQSLWWSDCHFPPKIEVYLGLGLLHAHGQDIDIRVRIEVIDCVIQSRPKYTAQVWVKPKGGTARKGNFYLNDAGRPYTYMDSMPDVPPDKIAFWRGNPDFPKVNLDNLHSVGVQPETTTREKRIARQKFLAESM